MVLGIINKIGIDMAVFPGDHHLTSHLERCLGNNESAGKTKSSKTPHKNKNLRAI